MPIRRGHSKRSSERDIALVQMQIAAQARNQRWHDFLCEKRDELQARLRQQGYSQSSQRSQRESHLAEGYAPEPDMAGVDAPHAASRRWGLPAGIPAPEVAGVPGVQGVSNPADESMAETEIGDYGGGAGVDVQPDGQQASIRNPAVAAIPGAEDAAWWDEKNGDPL